MTIYVYVTDGNQITIQMNDDATIHLHSQNRGIGDYEPIICLGNMAWKAGMFILKVTSSSEDTPEEQRLQVVNLLDAHENTLAEMDINKGAYKFFRDELNDIIASKSCDSWGFI